MNEHFNLNTDNTLGGNAPSHFTTPSQKAVKEYVDNTITGFHVCVTMTGSINQYDDTLITISSASHTGSQVSALLAEGKVVVVKLTISPADFYLTYVDGGYGHFECMYEGTEYIVRWSSISDMWIGEKIKINDRLTTAESNIATLQFHDAWPHRIYTSDETLSSHNSSATPLQPVQYLPSTATIEGGDIYLLFTDRTSTGNFTLYVDFDGIGAYFGTDSRSREIHVVFVNARTNTRTVNLTFPGMGSSSVTFAIPGATNNNTVWGPLGAEIKVIGRGDIKTGIFQYPNYNNRTVETRMFTWN